LASFGPNKSVDTLHTGIVERYSMENWTPIRLGN
jgi:hypothetical protein